MSDSPLLDKVSKTLDNLNCSFCGKNQREVQKLIAGHQVFICNECVELCADIIMNDSCLEAIRTTISGLGRRFMVENGEELTDFRPREREAMAKLRELLVLVEPDFFAQVKADYQKERDTVLRGISALPS